MIVIVASQDAGKAIELLNEQGENAWQIGRVVDGDPDAARAVHYV